MCAAIPSRTAIYEEIRSISIMALALPLVQLSIHARRFSWLFGASFDLQNDLLFAIAEVVSRLPIVYIMPGHAVV
jgi:hypothetical protein